MYQFGAFVRRRRYQLGMSPEVVAQAAGVSLSRWRQIEAGYSARGLTARQFLGVAEQLRMDVRDLVRVAAGREVA